jgi:hypothetical protein
MLTQITGWRIFLFGVIFASNAVIAAEKGDKARPGELGENPALAAELKDAFDGGYVVGPKSARDAAGRLEKLRRLAPADVRIDYAHGLILVKQSQNQQANARFEAAITRPGSPYWPTWKGAIWTHLLDKRYEQAMSRLVEFSVLVATPEIAAAANSSVEADDTPDVTDEQRAAARWIGQILEAISLIPDPKRPAALIEDRESRILDALGDDLAFSVEEGRELVRVRVAELDLAADTARDTTVQVAKRRKTDKLLDALDKGNVPQTPEEWKKWIDDLLTTFDKQLAQLDREYLNLQKRAEGLERSYVQSNQLLIAAKANRTLAHQQQAGPMGFVYWTEQMAIHTDAMMACQNEYNVVVDQLPAVARRATDLANLRATAIERYEKATGDTIPKNPDLDKWTTRLSDKRAKLATAKPAGKAAAKSGTGPKRPPTLKSLVPIDLERERDAVLASYGLRPAAPPAPPANPASGPAPKTTLKADQKSATPAQK